MTELLLKDEVYAVVGAAMAVYNELGPGFLEAVYHEAVEIELAQRGITFSSHVPLSACELRTPRRSSMEANGQVKNDPRIFTNRHESTKKKDSCPFVKIRGSKSTGTRRSP